MHLLKIVRITKINRDLALKKKSTLLFIQDNQENSNIPQPKNGSLRDTRLTPTNSALFRRKTMVEQLKSKTVMFTKSKSFKHDPPEGKVSSKLKFR